MYNYKKRIIDKMEYRLVRERDKPNYFQIYDESTSTLLGSAIYGRKWGLFRTLSIRLGDAVINVRNGLLSRRKWKHGEIHVSVRSKMLGRRIKVKVGEITFIGEKFEKGKLEIIGYDKGRTGLIIDVEEFSTTDMVLLQHFERFDLISSILVSVIVLKQYEIW